MHGDDVASAGVSVVRKSADGIVRRRGDIPEAERGWRSHNAPVLCKGGLRRISQTGERNGHSCCGDTGTRQRKYPFPFLQ